jgi:hypothetical protein
MENRIAASCDDRPGHDGGPQPIGEILAELLALYQVRYPEAEITVVEATVAA